MNKIDLAKANLNRVLREEMIKVNKAALEVKLTELIYDLQTELVKIKSEEDYTPELNIYNDKYGHIISISNKLNHIVIANKTT